MGSAATERTAPSDEKRRKQRPGPVVGVVRLLAIAATVTALVQELRKPRAQRTWHGKVWNVIPYDLRIPTAQRVKERMWAPSDREVIVPTVFGVGWTLNVGRLVAVLRRTTKHD